MESAGTDFKIQRLHNDAALLGPKLLQSEDQSLESANVWINLVSHGNHH
ncbi:hypothetical protein GCM10011352_41250 [Marinobacterium zhoushanense]|uniref:Uncharacterized protein n=1 Tax=Marinobacterium zhoushanense TaxID=1679163 RepID=A0ABQ1KU72_9GAMM|nr:hypothetical protein GCM10011352_41250 [Marinobacterium zhoushanense]